jgi:serine phosphatase RsbU (regulator of sigma subunit)
MRPLATRVVMTFAALDLTFKALVGLAFLMIMGGGDPARRDVVIDLLLRIGGPAWIVWLVLVWVLVRPIDELAVGDVERQVRDDLVERAGGVSARLPLRLASLWSLQWVGPFGAIAWVAGTGSSTIAVLLFLAALVLGPFPLAHALVVWMVTPSRRAIDILGHERGISLDIPQVTIRGRLTVYALCMVIAPSAYMAAIGLAGRAQMVSAQALAIAVGVGFLAVTVYAILLMLLVSTTLTRPLTDMAEIARSIAKKGETRTLARVPRLERDELGALVDLTNEMIEQLTRTEAEREIAQRDLEQLALSLEQRVQERTKELDQQVAERARLELQVAVAQHIQTSILPREWRVDGLEIAAKMVVATDVGGDYYDILPRPGGAWLAVGDVSGHGIGAGLIMMMLQSITAAFVEGCPTASTRELVVGINRVISENIRLRLRGDDYVTFMLLRYDTGGRVRHAGAHDHPIVWRASSGRCELIPTQGPWIGVNRNLDEAFVEQEFRLESGDLLVLYTDGITEAFDEERRQFGIERLCKTIEDLAHEPSVQAIADSVVEAAVSWCHEQEDDISIVVARQH